MYKFTFHMPVRDHDEFEVTTQVNDVTDAAEMLRDYLVDGDHALSVRIVRRNIDDGPRYKPSDVYDCPCFDEDGNQLD
ncbi:MAG: hypothetical protein ACK4S4_15590 [Pyrinomonadaceae bacterium]